MFLRDHRQNGIQQDHSDAGPCERIGFELGHILCNNSFVFFSSRRAPAGMLCPVKGLVLQGRARLLETVQTAELLGLTA